MALSGIGRWAPKRAQGIAIAKVADVKPALRLLPSRSSAPRRFNGSRANASGMNHHPHGSDLSARIAGHHWHLNSSVFLLRIQTEQLHEFKTAGRDCFGSQDAGIASVSRFGQSQFS